MKWLRKYPVLASVAFIAAATIARAFGENGWAGVIEGLAQNLDLVLDPNNATAIAEGFAGIVALTGVFTKLFRDRVKRNGQGSGDE